MRRIRAAVLRICNLVYRMRQDRPPHNIARTVLRETMTLVLGGILVGLALAVPLAQLVATLLFRVTPTDLDLLLAVATVIAVIGVLSGALPAWRASRIDPLRALRVE